MTNSVWFVMQNDLPEGSHPMAWRQSWLDRTVCSFSAKLGLRRRLGGVRAVSNRSWGITMLLLEAKVLLATCAEAEMPPQLGGIIEDEAARAADDEGSSTLEGFDMGRMPPLRCSLRMERYIACILSEGVAVDWDVVANMAAMRFGSTAVVAEPEPTADGTLDGGVSLPAVGRGDEPSTASRRCWMVAASARASMLDEPELIDFASLFSAFCLVRRLHIVFVLCIGR